MKRIFITTIFLCLLAASMPAQSRWVPAGPSAVSVEGVRNYVDRETVRWNGKDSVIFWWRSVQTDGSWNLYRLEMHRNRCARFWSRYGYDASGKSTYSDVKLGSWMEIPPDSIGDGMYDWFFTSAPAPPVSTY